MKYLKIEDTFKLVSEFDERNLGQFIDNHQLSQMIVLFCLDGSMNITIDAKSFRVESSSLVTIYPDLCIKLESLTKDFRCYLVSIPRELMTKAFFVKNVLSIESILFNTPVVKLDENGKVLFMHYFSFLSQIYEKLKRDHPEIIRCHLMALLMSLNAIYREQDAEQEIEGLSRSRVIAHQFIQLVRVHYREQHQLKFYADKLCITPKHLMAVVKKQLGKNPKRIIDEALIADAKLQLNTTGLCVKQICDGLCFANPSFFGKFFKQHVGVSPNAYRKGTD